MPRNGCAQSNSTLKPEMSGISAKMMSPKWHYSNIGELQNGWPHHLLPIWLIISRNKLWQMNSTRRTQRTFSNGWTRNLWIKDLIDNMGFTVISWIPPKTSIRSWKNLLQLIYRISLKWISCPTTRSPMWQPVLTFFDKFNITIRLGLWLNTWHGVPILL